MSWLTIVLSSVEVLFTCLKAAFLTSRLQRFRPLAVFCFVVESMAGIALTTLLSVAVFRSRRPDLGQELAVLSICLTELLSVVVESTNIYLKVRSQGRERKADTGQVRRVMLWCVALLVGAVTLIISIVSTKYKRRPPLDVPIFRSPFDPHTSTKQSSSSSEYALVRGVQNVNTWLQDNVLLQKLWLYRRTIAFTVLLVLCAELVIVFFMAVVHRRQYHLRVALVVFFLFADIIAVIIMLVIGKPVRNMKLDNEFFFEHLQGWAVFLMAAASAVTSLSGFRLVGFKECGKVTNEQAKFLETVLFSAVPSVFALVLCTDKLHSTLHVLLTIGPQIAVLTIPLLFEYVVGMCRSAKNSS